MHCTCIGLYSTRIPLADHDDVAGSVCDVLVFLLGSIKCARHDAGMVWDGSDSTIAVRDVDAAV